MEVRIRSVTSQIEANLPIAVENDFGLEKAELEMISGLESRRKSGFRNSTS